MNNIQILSELTENLTAPASISFSCENVLKATFVKFEFLFTKIHTPPILKEFLQKEAPKV